MTNTKKKEELKTVTKGVRLTRDMYALFTMMAKEQGVSVGKYLRDAGYILAEMKLDEKELLDLIQDKDKLKLQKTYHLLIQESRDTILNSIHNAHELVTQRIDKLEKLLEVFLYIYFFHTPELSGPKPKMEEIAKSALKRRKKALEIRDKRLEEERKANESEDRLI